jgi:hypothetical protein
MTVYTGKVTLGADAFGYADSHQLESALNQPSYNEVFVSAAELFACVSAGATNYAPTIGVCMTAAGSSVAGSPFFINMPGTITGGVATQTPVIANILLPRDWDEGTTIVPTIHFARSAQPGASAAGTGVTVGWYCQVKRVAEGSVGDGAQTIVTCHSSGETIPQATAENVYLVGRFSSIGASTYMAGDVLGLTFRRDMTGAVTEVMSDAGSVKVYGVGLIYKLAERGLGTDLVYAATLGASRKPNAG